MQKVSKKCANSRSWLLEYVDSDEIFSSNASRTVGSQIRCEFDIKPGFNEKNFILIIDEINRGKVSSILGELLFAIADRDDIDEAGVSHRMPVSLQYSGDSFLLSDRLHIIGTMNNADRSTDDIDQALKRRFAFHFFMPKAEVLSDVTMAFATRDTKITNLTCDKVWEIFSGIKATHIMSILNTAILNKKAITRPKERQIAHGLFITQARKWTAELTKEELEKITSAADGSQIQRIEIFFEEVLYPALLSACANNEFLLHEVVTSKHAESNPPNTSYGELVRPARIPGLKIAS
ncbi:MAG TPA: AAA family ATPase [Oligoflexus sp.]|uniref:AAA family ATPase n=1 Tax=Oligoflexus sp. TaxID=1971216 RepID=UPI002D73A732|nr:AAA family ATPase [Oligoflexus sp.]HYX38966.1 AAA family ATPase [Oligoflexus sp.]